MRWYTAANILGLAALFVVAGTLTPILGLSGPALGRASLMAVSTTIFAWATYKTGVFEIDFRAYIVAIGSSTVMMLVVFGIQSTLHSFLLRLLMLPILVIIGLLVYVGSLRVFHLLVASDIDFIRELVPRRLHGILRIVARLTRNEDSRAKNHTV